MEEKVTYFEKVGKENTEPTLKLALERAKTRGIKKVVMASTLGDTARLAAKLWKDEGIKLIIVPHQLGFAGMNFDAELKNELEKQGHVVHFGTMLFHTDKFYGVDTPTIMANLLRTFSQGMKVCVEIILMAGDAGHVGIGEKVVVVAGSGRGADTAVVAAASTSTHLADLHIEEIICKPLQTKQGPPPPPTPPTPPTGPMQTLWKKPEK
jgi:uncharacterized protein